MKIIIHKSKVKLIIYLFFLIYAPPIFPYISTIHVQTIFTFFLLYNNYWMETRKIFKQKHIRSFYKTYFIFICCLIIRILFSVFFNPINTDNYLTTLYKFFMVLIEIPICCAYVNIFCKKWKIDFNELLEIIVCTGILQLYIGILMATSPEIKHVLVSIMQQNNGKNIEDITEWEYNRRYFAFSDCMLDMLGWGLGIIAALPLFIEKSINKYYWILTPFLLVFAAMNSTTSIIVFTVMFIVYFVERVYNLRKNDFIKILVLPILFLMGIVIMRYIAPDSFEWFLNEIISIVNDNVEISSYRNVISREKWYLPIDLFQRLIGSGHTIYGANGFVHSDVGYINQIWLLGFIGASYLYYIFLKLFYNSFKLSNNKLVIALAFTFYLFEIKGIGISFNPGLSCVMIVLFNLFLPKN